MKSLVGRNPAVSSTMVEATTNFVHHRRVRHRNFSDRCETRLRLRLAGHGLLGGLPDQDVLVQRVRPSHELVTEARRHHLRNDGSSKVRGSRRWAQALSRR